MGIQLVTQVKVMATDDLYKIVNALNKNLKYDDLMFGIAKDEENTNLMVFSIYRT